MLDMKRVVFVVLLFGVGGSVRAQTFDEWFQQNSTRKKYQEQQIGALQLYITALEKGYGIVESGLSTIRGIKSGEFNLHSAFYTSLSNVSPVVSGMAEVAEIVALQAAIINRFSAELARYRQSDALRSDEVEYISAIYAEIVKEGLADISTLTDILTANILQLTDDERMAKVRGLDGQMQERYRATVALTDRTDMLMMQRSGASSDAATGKGWFGLP